jgi:hypothetical protein
MKLNFLHIKSHWTFDKRIELISRGPHRASCHADRLAAEYLDHCADPSGVHWRQRQPLAINGRQ